MPKATRKPGAGRVPPARHPDDELGFSWTPDAEDQLVGAAEALKQRNDARLLVRLLLDLRLLPRAVRPDFARWLGDPLPPRPEPLSPKYQATREAVDAYGRTRAKRNAGGGSEGPERRATRVLDTLPREQPGRWRQHGVTEKLLLGVKNNNGSQAYRAIRDYLDAAVFYGEDY